jgi:hypothetical protein
MSLQIIVSMSPPDRTTPMPARGAFGDAAANRLHGQSQATGSATATTAQCQMTATLPLRSMWGF